MNHVTRLYLSFSSNMALKNPSIDETKKKPEATKQLVKD